MSAEFSDDGQSDEHSENDNNDSRKNEYDNMHHYFKEKMQMCVEHRPRIQARKSRKLLHRDAGRRFAIESEIF